MRYVLIFSIHIFSFIILQAMPTGIKVEHSGRMNVAGLNAAIACFDTRWHLSRQGDNTITPLMSYPVPGDKVYELQGTFRLKNGSEFYLQQIIREISPDTVKFTVSIRSEKAIPVKSLFYEISLPVHAFKEKEIRIDGENFPLQQARYKKISVLEIPYRDHLVVIRGNFPLIISDNQKFNVPSFSLRLGLTPAAGAISSAEQTFSIQVKKRNFTQLDLAQAAGSGTILSNREAVSFVKRWKLDSGAFVYGGLRFTTPDKKRLNGTVLLLENGKRLRLPAKNAGSHFYLLQNADSKDAAPVLNIEYDDGSSEQFDLKPGRDFDVSKPLKRLPNGALCASENYKFTGLYFSVFSAKNQNVKTIELANNGRGRWYVVAITACQSLILPASVESIKYMIPDEQWVPFENVKNVAKGSILDFSTYTEAPAGKYGRIIIDKHGHFTTEKNPDKRIRFFGVNLVTTGQVQDHKTAEELADNLAKMGYNAVRFHHFERFIVDPRQKDSCLLDAELLDKMEYLFAALKKRGIYMTLDLYCSRAVRPEELPENARKNFKGMVLINQQVYENYKRFVRNRLTHKNPYTGMTWGEDPALYAVCLVNESAPYQSWTRSRSEFQKAYSQYLKDKGLNTIDPAKLQGEGFYRFLREINIDFVRRATRFLRDEINYQGLITHLNHRQHLLNCDIREELDFVDNHNYWDHPNFLPGKNWGFPRLHNQMSAICAGAWNPRTLMPSRIFGKPFTVTEYNFTFPNRYRAEGGPLFGGYAAFQDWDGLYRFAWWSHMRETRLHEAPINGFDIAEDSNAHLSERLIWALFLRGDVSSGREAVAWPYGESVLKNWKSLDDTVYPVDFQKLGFNAKIGSLRENSSLPGVQLLKNPHEFTRELTPRLRALYKSAPAVSDTGEIFYGDRQFRIITPKTESLALFNGNAGGHVLQVRNADSFQVISAISMDEKPLAQSKKILIFHQSDVVNQYLRYSSETENAVESWGINKPLIRKAKSTVILTLPSSDYKGYAIGLDGLPKSQISLTNQNGQLCFTADTAAHHGTMIYLVQREP